jgi:hypothetical protein
MRSPKDCVSPRAAQTSAVLARTSAYPAPITDRSPAPDDCDVESERATADRVGFFLPCQLVFTVAVVGYE